ncbi:MAG: hypothetical protein M3Z18_02730 [Gemmatimonadota bacterium]|nr:hypothetical protein [Gemmatimonadota bacterium]
MTEDKFEDFLKKAAQGYNVPPARAPREEMWSAIQAQRAAGPRVLYGGGSTAPESSARRFGSRVWLGAAAAAVLFLATGVGIGRWSASPTTRTSATTANPTKTGSSPSLTELNASASAPANVDLVASGQIRGSTSEPASSAPASSNRATRGTGVQQVDLGRDNGTRLALSGPSSNSSSAAASAYQLAAIGHLSEAEALLTSFRTRTSTDQQADAQLGAWARDLLTNTRLLLDSPVANDPQRRPLLEDLELVLVQIVQLSPGSPPQDRELIEKTLQHDHVMTRLRTAIPAGLQRGS